MIAADWDKRIPSTESWHKELLNQMPAPTANRPAVISSELVESLSEFLAFRHLFRGAAIALMRWNKLAPLPGEVDLTYRRTKLELEGFQHFLHPGGTPAQ